MTDAEKTARRFKHATRYTSRDHAVTASDRSYGHRRLWVMMATAEDCYIIDTPANCNRYERAGLATYLD